MRLTKIKGPTLSVVLLILAAGSLQPAAATAFFARKYDTQCNTCHVIPPKLNRTGEQFLANGYKFAAGAVPAKRTLPFAVWATWRGEVDQGRDRGRGLPNRVELIFSGPVGKSRASYFIEWLPVSQQRDAANRRIQRHGRFEDLQLSLPVFRSFVTVGQFRPLAQVDVSRRFSLSEPLAFSTGVAGPPALSSRLTSLRAFSASGRSPAVRFSHQWTGASSSDGFHVMATLPFAGEFVIPLTPEVHRTQGFEFEARPKGVFLESFYRRGLSSIGAHAFLGDERRLVGLVAVGNRGPFFSTLAVVRARERSGQSDTRVSWENELVPVRWLALGLRLDDRTGANRPLAVIPHVNVMFPLTSYMLRFTVEHRQQRANRQWLIELGTVF